MPADPRRSRPSAPAVLLLTSDPQLAERVSGQLPRTRPTLTVLDGPRNAGQAWNAAAHVLVDAALAGALRRARLPARPGVALVLGADAAQLEWQDAVAIGIDRMLEPDEVGSWLAEQGPSEQPLEGRPLASAARGRLVVVTGASGGCGTSTLAAALGVVADGARLLVDLDVGGGGLDLVLGLEEHPGPRWAEAHAADTALMPRFDALPTTADGLAVLSHDGRLPADADPRSAGEVVGQVLDAALRRYPLVIADLPRTGRPDLLPDAGRAATAVLLIVPPDIRGCAAALSRCRSLDGWPDLRLVVGPRPEPVLDEATVAVGLDLPVAGVLPYDPAVPAAAARGELPVTTRRSSYGRAVSRLLRGLESPRSR